ncbi:MAG: DUF4174 domain-containing protein [Bacteroidota bacterium]
MNTNIGAQNEALAKYQWKNRILVIVDSKNTSELYKKQIELLGELDESFDERKLLVFYAYEDGYKILNGDRANFVSDSSLYSELTSESSKFKVALFGLDGGIKLNKPVPISKSDLFAIIDGMPMRKAEIRQKN